MNRRRNNIALMAGTREGMTLIELLAAILIMAMVSAGLLAVFSSTIKAREKVNKTLSSIERAAGIMDILVKDLGKMHVYDSRAYLLVEKQDSLGPKVCSLAFPCLTSVRVSEDLREKPGLIEIAYLPGPDLTRQGQMRLFRRELPVQTDTSQTEIRSSSQGLVLLADGLTDFSIEFLAPESDEADAAAPTFEDTWDGGFGTEALPAALRIRVAVAGSGSTPPVVLERTIRLPIASIDNETLQPQLQEALADEG